MTAFAKISKKILGEIGEDIPQNEFTDINPLCITSNILENKISYLGIPVSDECLKKYKLFGKYDWEYIKEKYLLL